MDDAAVLDVMATEPADSANPVTLTGEDVLELSPISPVVMSDEESRLRKRTIRSFFLGSRRRRRKTSLTSMTDYTDGELSSEPTTPTSPPSDKKKKKWLRFKLRKPKASRKSQSAATSPGSAPMTAVEEDDTITPELVVTGNEEEAETTNAATNPFVDMAEKELNKMIGTEKDTRPAEGAEQAAVEEGHKEEDGRKLVTAERNGEALADVNVDIELPMSKDVITTIPPPEKTQVLDEQDGVAEEQDVNLTTEPSVAVEQSAIATMVKSPSQLSKNSGNQDIPADQEIPDAATVENIGETNAKPSTSLEGPNEKALSDEAQKVVERRKSTKEEAQRILAEFKSKKAEEKVGREEAAKKKENEANGKASNVRERKSSFSSMKNMLSRRRRSSKGEDKRASNVASMVIHDDEEPPNLPLAAIRAQESLDEEHEEGEQEVGEQEVREQPLEDGAEDVQAQLQRARFMNPDKSYVKAVEKSAEQQHQYTARVASALTKRPRALQESVPTSFHGVGKLPGTEMWRVVVSKQVSVVVS